MKGDLGGKGTEILSKRSWLTSFKLKTAIDLKHNVGIDLILKTIRHQEFGERIHSTRMCGEA